jgi:hypothetical protein
VAVYTLLVPLAERMATIDAKFGSTPGWKTFRATSPLLVPTHVLTVVVMAAAVGAAWVMGKDGSD